MRASRALGNHCFGSALRSHVYVPNVAAKCFVLFCFFTSNVVRRLSYAYKLIMCILLTLSDGQYLKLEADGAAPLRTVANIFFELYFASTDAPLAVSPTQSMAIYMILYLRETLHCLIL